MSETSKPQNNLHSAWVTVESARARLAYIWDIAGDDEAAHSEEDQLRRDVLETIALLTEIALETSRIDFARWCA